MTQWYLHMWTQWYLYMWTQWYSSRYCLGITCTCDTVVLKQVLSGYNLHI